MCIWYNLCMYLVLCHVSGKTDLVTPINSVLFCSVLSNYGLTQIPELHPMESK